MTHTSGLGHLVQHTAVALRQQTDQILQERLGIGMSQFKLLITLQDRPQITQRGLADHLKQTEASISRQVKLLCEKGLLSVTTNPRSHREHIMAITPKGARLTEAAREVVEEHSKTVFSTLEDKQQQQLLESINAIHRAVCPGDAGRADCSLMTIQKV